MEWQAYRLAADGNLVCFLFCCSTLGIFMVLWACGELTKDPQSVSAYMRLCVGLSLFAVILYRFRRFKRTAVEQQLEEQRQREAIGVILLLDRLAPVVGVPCTQTVGQAVPANGIPLTSGSGASALHPRNPAELPAPLPAGRRPSLFSEPPHRQLLPASAASLSPPEAAAAGPRGGRMRVVEGSLMGPRRGSRTSIPEPTRPRGRRRALTLPADV
eukprot:Hpha_TRINITY_DN25919_c0_g1::TRINITY_DN25919_c0_g1_i1::g.185399::m.185399